jgi:hypothetical protein
VGRGALFAGNNGTFCHDVLSPNYHAFNASVAKKVTRKREIPGMGRRGFALGSSKGGDNPMRRAFNIAVVVLVGFLIADRTAMHVQAHEQASISCAAGADLVRLDALNKGFSDAGATNQGDAFRSSCFVTGRAQIGDLIARD